MAEKLIDLESAREARAPRAVEEAVGRALVAAGALGNENLERARRLQASQEPREPLTRVLVKLGLVSEREAVDALAAELGMAVVAPAEYPEEPLEPAKVAAAFLHEHASLVLAEDEERVVVAVADPFDGYLVDALRLACDKTVELRLAVPSELEAALAAQTEGRSRGAAGAPDEADEVRFEADAERLKELASEAPVVKLVSQLLQRAVESRASDIHVEPFEERLRLRYRIDGVLREVDSRPLAMASAVISRIKIMANLNIAERRLPQDGRMKTRALGRDIDLRVSTVPTLFGESVVIRLLNRDDIALDFPALGFGEPLCEQMAELLARPHGILLVTGPTGSGKTTTLYAALRRLNTPERKILTVEDPVEYNLEGVNQIQVKPQIGLNFANALRSIVRQDPDVIMIGEMRDRETADIAVQSALTGHLVLSTLHTNDAPSAITRLLDMGVEDFLLTSTVLGILAQRLVRVICPQCRVDETAPAALIERWDLARLHQGAGPPHLHRGGGCEHCQGTGYSGRTSVVELMVMSDAVRDLVLRRADAGQLAKAARREGMGSMFEEGLRKAVAGETTLDEVLRVTREA